MVVVVGLGTNACRKNPAQVSRPVQFDPAAAPYPKLSDYAFFKGELNALQPNDRVLPYDLITPLFTDYAHKSRFVWMPEGVSATVSAEGDVEFPDQTVLIKNFYYPADFRKPDKKWDIVETRLLVKTEGEWKAYTYVWNEEDSDADFNQVGDIKQVAWMDLKGQARQVDFIIPNKNQCKSCHNRDNTFQPIGPKIRNLNRAMTYSDGQTLNQVEKWQQAGYLAAGDHLAAFPPVADWDDPKSGDLHARALAYLDVNCGHCHNPHGPAHTSGLFLTAGQTNPTMLGINKPPVAAGRGSGNRRFGITPGHPEGSILLYRMVSNDPGEMMPELGRAVAHEEAISLIRDWIAAMPETK